MNQEQLETLLGMAKDFVDTADDFGLQVPKKSVPDDLLFAAANANILLGYLCNDPPPSSDTEYVRSMSEVQAVFSRLIEALKGARIKKVL